MKKADWEEEEEEEEVEEEEEKEEERERERDQYEVVHTSLDFSWTGAIDSFYAYFMLSFRRLQLAN